MFDYISKISRVHPIFSDLCNTYKSKKATIIGAVDSVNINCDDSFNELRLGDASEFTAMVSGISVYNDTNSKVYTLTENLSTYITNLGILKCFIGDIVPQGNSIITTTKNRLPYTYFIKHENNAISVYCNAGIKEVHYSLLNTQNEFVSSLNDIDVVDSEKLPTPLSFVVKAFQCIKEGISISIENKSEQSYNPHTKLTRLKDVKYISLSHIGEIRNNELTTALERIKSDSIYSIASWYRRPHYRKGNIYVKGCWCNRKDTLLAEDNREVRYCM